MGFALSLLISGCDSNQGILSIEIKRTITLPVPVVRADTPDSTGQLPPENLEITLGGVDELPRGPQGYAVLPSGGFVVTDPLRKRLVFYDSLGVYEGAWQIGIPADRVAYTDGDLLEVRHAYTNTYFRVDEFQALTAIPQDSRSSRIRGDVGRATLDRSTGDRGTITFQGIRGMEDTLDVTFSSDEQRMVSLQHLGMTSSGQIFVALEVSGGEAAIDIKKFIRLYDRSGRLLGQSTPITFDNFIMPIDVFNVIGDTVYQLVVEREAVVINVWGI